MKDINRHDVKFVVAPADLVENTGEQLVILTDIEYWNDNYDKLQFWCNHNHGTVKGMLVALPTSHALIAFCLRWS